MHSDTRSPPRVASFKLPPSMKQSMHEDDKKNADLPKKTHQKPKMLSPFRNYQGR